MRALSALCAGLLSAGWARGAVAAEAALVATAPDVEGPASVEAAPPIVVTGSRTARPLSEAPVSTEVVSREEIDQAGARTVADALEERAGLYIEPSIGGAGVQLQGLDADYTLILIDGQRVIGRVGGVLDLRRIPIEEVERIEIVRGASSALYGSDALGGVINIITKRTQRDYELDAQGSYGERHRLDVRGRGGVRFGPSWSSLSGGLRRSDAYDLDPASPATSGSQVRQYEATLRTGYELGSTLDVSASAEYRYRAQDGIDESGAGAILHRRNRTEDANVFLRPEWTPRAGTRLSLRFGYSFFRDQFMLDQREGIALDDYQDTREQLLQAGAQLDQWIGARHLASLGVEGFHEALESQRLSGGTGDRQRGAVYAQDEWTLLERPLLVLLPGARLDLGSDFGAHVTPRIAARADPAAWLTLRASFGFGFRAPDFREQLLLFENPGAGYVVVGNPELDPERSRNVTLGAELHPARSVWLSLSAFHNALSDMIATQLTAAGGAGSAMRFQYDNVSSAYTRGVEAAVRLSPLSGLRLDLGYTLVDARDEELERPLAGRPKHRSTLSLRYRDAGTGFETSWRAALVGERYYYEDEDGDGAEERRAAAAYASVDLRVAQRVAAGLSAFGLAENLLDAGDPELLAIPPRTFSVGLTYAE